MKDMGMQKNELVNKKNMTTLMNDTYQTFSLNI